MKLEAQKISFGYPKRGKKAVLQELDFSLESGERVGLSAPSGRGKTTLCRLLAGYEKPQQGKILLDGKNLGEVQGFCPVQMIWQHPELAVNPLLRLKKTLEEAGPVEEALLEKLSIRPQWLNRYPAELSGGELQRFCIARAMQPQLRFLLCDEITAMLDLVTQAQIWDFLIRECKQRNLGLLIVSHNRGLLEKLCTRIVTLPDDL